MEKALETGSGDLELGDLKPGVSDATDHRTLNKDANTDSVLADLETRLGERIQQEVERRFQSAKDKRWSQLERQYGALSEMAKAPEPGQRKAPAKPTHGELASARRLMAQAGLMQDPEAMELLCSYGMETPEAGSRLLEGIGQLALRRLSRQPVKAGAVIQPWGGMAARDLRGDYERRLRSVRPGDVAGLAELEGDFRKKGLDVF